MRTLPACCRPGASAALSASTIRSSRRCSFSTRSAVTCIGARWPASSQRTSALRSSAASIMRSRSFGTASESATARREVQAYEGLVRPHESTCEVCFGALGGPWRNRLFSSFQIHISSLHSFSCADALHERQRAWRGTEMSKTFQGGSPMAWLFLLVAGLCEIAWAIGLKYTEGFSRLFTIIGPVAAMMASIGCLGLALKSLPVGTAYAVWTGIGTAGTTALGIYLFNEPATLLRLACIGLILSGIIGLKITS